MLLSIYIKLKLKCDWLFCFTVPFSLAEKKMRFGAKILRFVYKSPLDLTGVN